MTRILLDCDPGIDDSIAILLALKSPELDVEAITTVTGNLTADRATVNALKVLELIGAPVPVAQGMLRPLARPYPRDPFSHGDDGLGNTNLPDPERSPEPFFAPDLIVDVANTHPGEISLVATGPLTNVAMALHKDPELSEKINQLVMIGGAFGFNRYAFVHATGDNPVSEWNVYVDPEAAKLVFESGMNITAIGLDVATHPDNDLTEAHLNRLRDSGRREARYALDLLDFVTNRGFPSYPILIDSLAIAAMVDQTLVKTEKVNVDVETKGELTRGMTVADVRANFRWEDLPEIRAAREVDFARFLDLLVGEITR